MSHTKDYSVTIEDATGRTAKIFVNGGSIDDLMAKGFNRVEAVEGVEESTFQAAIRDGLIGADAWLVSTDRNPQE